MISLNVVDRTVQVAKFLNILFNDIEVMAAVNVIYRPFEFLDLVQTGDNFSKPMVSLDVINGTLQIPQAEKQQSTFLGIYFERNTLSNNYPSTLVMTSLKA